MEKEQFLKFRMALLPASGFQSAQYRLIEICSTAIVNLVHTDERDRMRDADLEAQMKVLYWKSGATELKSGKKTLTLQQFEKKYSDHFFETAKAYHSKNLRQIFLDHFQKSDEVIVRLKEFDQLANVLWPLAHMRSAGRYLHKDPEDIKATGGTNWQKYLPPRFQKIVFFPEIWTEKELQEWGKAGVVGPISER
jgi:tryptophan 2,3-dioxygenase